MPIGSDNRDQDTIASAVSNSNVIMTNLKLASAVFLVLAALSENTYHTPTMRMNHYAT